MRSLAIGSAIVFAFALGTVAFSGLPSRHPLSLEFRDSLTGQAVTPDQLLVRTPGSQEPAFAGPTDAHQTLQLGEGTYEVRAVSSTHGTMVAQVAVSAHGSPLVRFQMDPVKVPPEVTPQAVREAHRPDAHLMLGFVVDDATGKPLDGVRVLGTGGLETQTDGAGFFRLALPPKGAPAVRFELPGFAPKEHRNLEVWNGGDSVHRVRMRPGKGLDVVDERAEKRRANVPEPDQEAEDENCDGCTKTVANAESAPEPEFDQPAVVALPKYIRVGRNCASRTTCTVVEVYTVDTYCKRVLPAEWYACWGNVAGGIDCLKAGAVAVRSYGVSFVYTPATANYDICDTTSCQVMGNTTASNTDAGVNQSSGYVLLTSSGAIARSEYSAENNNNGCGDGFAGTGTTWPCIADPVCSGFADNGHGRGLCQWGSARWATGRRLSSSQACTSSAPLTGFGTKNWLQILAHYYPSYTATTAGVATITDLQASPNQVVVGTTTTLQFALSANHAINAVILGASIAPTGTSNWASHPAGDRRLNLAAGTSTEPRPFAVGANQPWGLHDVLTSLYFDKNNNSVIDSGDFIVADGRFNGRLTIRSAIAVTISPTHVKVMRGKTKQFTAQVTGHANTAISWSVASGPGTISATGLYTASTTQGGESVVQAASVADPSRTASAKVYSLGSIGF